MSNVITIEFSTEDRARLDKLQAILEAIGESIGTKAVFVELGTGGDEPAETTTAPQSKPAEPTPTTNQAKTESPEKEATAPNIMTGPQSAPSVKLADIQSTVVTLSAKGKKAEVRGIIKAYADRVTALPEDKWDEVYSKLKALEA